MSFEDMKTIIFNILEQIQQVLVEAIKSHLISLSMTPLVQPLEEEYDQKFFNHHTYNSSIPKGKWRYVIF